MPDVAPDHAVERRHDPGCGGVLRPHGSVVKVVSRLNLHVSRERRKARQDDEQQDEALDRPEQVLEAKTPLECEAVDGESGASTGEFDATLGPVMDFDAGSV